MGETTSSRAATDTRHVQHTESYRRRFHWGKNGQISPNIFLDVQKMQLKITGTLPNAGKLLAGKPGDLAFLIVPPAIPITITSSRRAPSYATTSGVLIC